MDGWDVIYAPLPETMTGMTDWRTRTIVIDPAYPAATQRSTRAHEEIHVERGPSRPPFDVDEELAVEKAAARRLIDVRDLGEAMVESQHLGHVAELLHVDPDMLTVRLRHLHPSERHYLRRRLEAKEDPC